MPAPLRTLGESRLRALRVEPDQGGSAVEYALLAAAVAGLIAVAVFMFGGMVLQINQDNCDSIAATASPSSSCG